MDVREYRPADESSASNATVVAFYEKLGYAQDETIVLGKRLIRDDTR